MNKYYKILIPTIVAIICATFIINYHINAESSTVVFDKMSISKINKQMILIKNNMSISEIKMILGEEDGIFEDDHESYQEYVWINYKTKSEARVKFVNGKSVNKEFKENIGEGW